VSEHDAPGWEAEASGWETEAGEIDAGAAPTAPPRRAVGLTFVGVLGVVILAAVGVGFYLLYHHESQRARGYQAQVVDLRTQLAAADKRANSAFVRGITAKMKIDKSLGYTYGGGFQAGWTAAFGGFASWQDGNWYLVQIVHGENGHQITSRLAVTPCQRMYLSNNQIYTQGSAC
jgi:hypothetical protein